MMKKTVKLTENDLTKIIQKVIKENDENETLYGRLMDIKNGDYVTSSELGSIDPLIYKINYNESNPLASMIFIRFDDDSEFFKLFDIPDYEVNTLSRIAQGYFDELGWDFYQQEWDEGYLIYEFSPENMGKIEEIWRLILPDVKFESNNYGIFSKKLEQLMDREVSRIIDYYKSGKDQTLYEIVEEDIKNSYCSFFREYGIVDRVCYYEYKTTVKMLLSLFETYNSESESLTDLLGKIAYESNNTTNYSESNFFEVNDVEKFESFKESFNSSIEPILDNILEEINEMEEYSGETFRKYLKHILPKYDLRKWYPLPYDPKSKTKKFSIVDFSHKKDRIIVKYMAGPGKIEDRSYDYESFVDFLNNPELFESKIVGKRKIPYI